MDVIFEVRIFDFLIHFLSLFHIGDCGSGESLLKYIKYIQCYA